MTLSGIEPVPPGFRPSVLTTTPPGPELLIAEEELLCSYSLLSSSCVTTADNSRHSADSSLFLLFKDVITIHLEELSSHSIKGQFCLLLFLHLR